jgi:hypothetical protein
LNCDPPTPISINFRVDDDPGCASDRNRGGRTDAPIPAESSGVGKDHAWC